MWVHDPLQKEGIQNHWSYTVRLSPPFILKHKLSHSANELQKWHKIKFRAIEREIKEIDSELSSLAQKGSNACSPCREVDVTPLKMQQWPSGTWGRHIGPYISY